MLTIAGGILLAILILAFWDVLLLIAFHVAASGGLLAGIGILVGAASSSNDPDTVRFMLALATLCLLISGHLCWVMYLEPLWWRWRERRN